MQCKTAGPPSAAAHYGIKHNTWTLPFLCFTSDTLHSKHMQHCVLNSSAAAKKIEEPFVNPCSIHKNRKQQACLTPHICTKNPRRQATAAATTTLHLHYLNQHTPSWSTGAPNMRLHSNGRRARSLHHRDAGAAARSLHHCCYTARHAAAAVVGPFKASGALCNLSRTQGCPRHQQMAVVHPTALHDSGISIFI